MGNSPSDVVGSLLIHAHHGTSDNPQVTELWAKNGYQSGGWQQGRAHVGAFTNFQVKNVAFLSNIF